MGSYLSKPSQPPIVAGDKVIPLDRWNSSKMTRPIIIDLTLRFDDCLDITKLSSAIDRLLEKEDWRMLGARMRENQDGKLVYHIPKAFSEERPGFILTEKKFDISIDDHPLGSKIPRPPTEHREKPFFVGDTTIFSDLTRTANTPTKIEDWFHQDIPQLFLHASSFEDVTLLTVTWCHTLADAMGMSFILNAISLVLQNRDSEVPAYLAYSEPLDTLGKDADPKQSVLHDHRLGIFGSIRLGLNLAFDLLINRNNSLRAFCLPKSFVDRIYAEALVELGVPAELANQPYPRKIPEDKFVSESDVILAWWTRTFFSALNPRRKDTTANIMNVFDYRGLIPDLLPTSGVYVGNATLVIMTMMSVQEIIDSSLGAMAKRIRDDIKEQRTREQLLGLTAMHRVAMDTSGGNHAMFGKSDQYLIPLSNWHRGKLFLVDFSAALAEPARKEADGNAGKPSYIMPNSFNNGFSIRNFGAVVGKDHDRNFWISWYTGNDTWAAIEKEWANPH